MKGLEKKGFATKVVHSERKEKEYGTLAFPIYASSTFAFENTSEGGRKFAKEEIGFTYSRLGNPSTAYLQEKIARLEESEAALALSSGMGAIGTTLFTLLQAGDHIIADDVLYGCTRALIENQLGKFNVEYSFIDLNNLELVKATIKENTKVLYFETPANPTLKLNDIEALASIAKANGIVSVVDNTIATPYLTKPITLGVDVVVHSATKYLNGHGDVVAGIICGTNEFIEKCRYNGQKEITGSVMSAFDAYLINRGLKTLEVRMEKICKSAMSIALYLENHPAISKVYYPGLPSFKNHEIAKKQMINGYSGMIAFEVEGGYDKAMNFANDVELFTLAVSLGDCESLIQHPASMTHATYPKEAREAAGISDSLLRLSTGLESVEDLIFDIEQALSK